MGDERMPKVDQIKDKAAISANLTDYMKLFEQQNLERVAKLKRTRRNNLITGAALGAWVLGIYAYSILSVKQEKFLDDFNEPAVKDIENKL